MSKDIESVVVRVLADLPHEGKFYAPNQLVELPKNQVAVFKKNGSVDDNKAAVDYCKSELKAEVIVHISVADELAAIAAAEQAASEAVNAENKVSE